MPLLLFLILLASSILFYLYIRGFALISFSKDNIIKISRYEILGDLGISNLTLGKYLKYLKDKKLIFKNQIRENGKFSTNEYSFSEGRDK